MMHWICSRANTDFGPSDVEAPEPLFMALDKPRDGDQNILIGDGKIVDKVHEGVIAVCVAVLRLRGYLEC